MSTRKFLFGLCALALLAVAPQLAQAQATRTWVSGVGDDVNPCSRTAPCKTFAGAISKTASGGEINTLDPGGFGAVTITKPITIRSDHVEAGISASGTNGIIVNNALGGRVVLEGLDLDGFGTGLDGVKIIQGGSVYIIRCRIHRFTLSGVTMISSTANGRVLIKDSTIIGNTIGVNVQGAGGVANIASIFSTLIDSNTNSAVRAFGVGNVIGVASSVLNNSPAALDITAGATSVSFGPSNVLSGTGVFTTTNAFK